MVSDIQKYAFMGLTRIPKELEKILAADPNFPQIRPASATIASNDFGLLCASATLSDMLFFSPPSAVREQVKRNELVKLELVLPAQLQTHFAIVSLRSRKLSVSAELMKHTITECAALQFSES